VLTRLVASLAIDAATMAIDRAYDYLVPGAIAETVSVGSRVLVPFGKGNRLREALVLKLEHKEPERQLKTINALLDEKPVLDAGQLKLAFWLRERCFCTLYDAVKVILPQGLWFHLKEEWSLTVSPEEALLSAGRSEIKKQVIDILARLGGKAAVSQLRAAMGGKDASAALRELENEGVIALDTDAKRAAADKKTEVAVLCVTGEEALDFAARREKRARGQAEAAKMIAQLGEVSVRELSYFTGASAASIRSLEKYGIVQIVKRDALRTVSNPVRSKAAPLVLNRGQSEAYEGLAALLDKGEAAAALLKGVTGSGKTAVYIKLVQRALQMGKTALILVPEIALTPGLLGVFTSFFGSSVAVLHSALRTTQKYDLWKKIRDTDEIKVVLGTRSAVFSPLKDLGLIVIDEEQEHTYKSENSPCYHARDVAKYRCVASKALLVLGSATPSVESMYWAQQGKYSFFELTERYNTQPLPKVIVADMKQELRRGVSGNISTVLKEEIEKNLELSQQSILFINRRGNSRLHACGECGHVHFCPRCSVAMTYHSANRRLMCHYCGHSEPLMDTCPECGGQMKYVGAGTQKIEQELSELFPGVEVIRMDTDTVGAAGSHDKLLTRFEKEKVPILIGTQMITKGLDFENVTLVGVLAADLSLYTDDYRAYERTFSLITQVVGRAGRGDKTGRAVIQTYTPDNEVIRYAACQDYDSFYNNEIRLRAARTLPPFTDIVTVTFSGTQESEVIKCCASFRARLDDCLKRDWRDLDMIVLGPAVLPIAKVNDKFRYRLTLQCKNDKKTRNLISAILREFKQDSQDISIFADIE